MFLVALVDHASNAVRSLAVPGYGHSYYRVSHEAILCTFVFPSSSQSAKRTLYNGKVNLKTRLYSPYPLAAGRVGSATGSGGSRSPVTKATPTRAG